MASRNTRSSSDEMLPSDKPLVPYFPSVSSSRNAWSMSVSRSCWFPNMNTRKTRTKSGQVNFWALEELHARKENEWLDMEVVSTTITDSYCIHSRSLSVDKRLGCFPTIQPWHSRPDPLADFPNSWWLEPTTLRVEETRTMLFRGVIIEWDRLGRGWNKLTRLSNWMDKNHTRRVFK